MSKNERMDRLHEITGESAPAGVLAVKDLAWAGRILRDLYSEDILTIDEYLDLEISLFSKSKFY